MRIKRPFDDKALKDLDQILSSIEIRFRDCIYKGHDVFDILYVSSLIISPYVKYNGIRLLDKIKSISNIEPRRIICLIRTTAPSYFPKKRGKGSRISMRTLQKKAIDYLRDKCYVIVYDPYQTFLNHAKFLIYYHICNSEKNIYRIKYYGSTNFTAKGLAYIWDLKGKGKIGNYEEYVVARHILRRLNKHDVFYLDEVKKLIKHKARLYTDLGYLSRFLYTHLHRIELILGNSRQIVSGTPLGLLFKTYLDLATVYSQSLALLDEIPGKKVTEEIQNDLFEILEPIDPFVIEMITPINVEKKISPRYYNVDSIIEEFEILARDLELKDKDLRNTILEFINVIENTRNLLQKRYLLKNEKNEVIETPEQMFERVAKSIASNDEEKKEFYELMTSLRFLPNSPTLMNAGTKLGQLSACFTGEQAVSYTHLTLPTN